MDGQEMWNHEGLSQEQVLRQNLAFFFKGDPDAIEFFMTLWRITQTWDDLIDKDTECADQDINDAFRMALIELPVNRFYAINQHILTPLILNMILEWQDANVLEQDSEHDRHMAWMLRAGILEIIPMCAYIIGGADWAREQGPEMRRIYQEKLEDFMKEMETCHQSE